jgi:hypothetical protein
MGSGDSDDAPNCKPEQPAGSDDEFAGENWRRLLLSAVHSCFSSRIRLRG